jgi:glycosyltransferase involved in cell wall biosynthesis
MKKALLIAYHYPPIRVSSGVQRTLAFSRYLSESGWLPSVLTAHPRSYAAVSNDQLKDIPNDVTVKRAFALDTAKHLSFKGRYFGWMALPDRWISWWLSAVFFGLRMIRQEKPSVIFTTYPIATAHLVGLALHRLTGIPWVADFRDSMFDEVSSLPRQKKLVFEWIDRKTVENCSAAIFTTRGAVELYTRRYPHISTEKWHLIPNGYNEEIFQDVEQQSFEPKELGSPLTLIHSGVLYPSERDPRAFFQAIAELKEEGELSAKRVCIVLRATGHDDQYGPLLKDAQIDDIVKLEPGVSYREALSEMLKADGLLIFQASNCNHQVPAKLYEYFRAKRPIFALTDKQGDTAKTLIEAGVKAIVPLDDKNTIKAALLSFIYAVEKGGVSAIPEEIIDQYSRRSASKRLGVLFDQVLVGK